MSEADRPREAPETPEANLAPASGAQSEESDPVAELIDYLWGSPVPPPLLFRTVGFARASPLAAIGEREAGERPSTLPLGVIHLYPRFLAFLDSGAGATTSLAGLTLAPLGRESFDRLPATERARLSRPLWSPGALVIPIADVSAVHGSRWLGLPCIELSTHHELFRLGPHPKPNDPSSRFATRWEPQLHDLLRDLVEGVAPKGAPV